MVSCPSLCTLPAVLSVSFPGHTDMNMNEHCLHLKHECPEDCKLLYVIGNINVNYLHTIHNSWINGAAAVSAFTLLTPPITG